MIGHLLMWMALGAVFYGLLVGETGDGDIFRYGAILVLWPFIALSALASVFRGSR